MPHYCYRDRGGSGRHMRYTRNGMTWEEHWRHVENLLTVIEIYSLLRGRQVRQSIPYCLLLSDRASSIYCRCEVPRILQYGLASLKWRLDYDIISNLHLGRTLDGKSKCEQVANSLTIPYPSNQAYVFSSASICTSYSQSSWRPCRGNWSTHIIPCRYPEPQSSGIL